MDIGRFEDLVNHIDAAFIEVNKRMTGIDFTKCEPDELSCKKVLSIMIKLHGSESGIILMTASYETANIITEAINDEPLDSEEETQKLFAEFANIFAGRATSQFNKIYTQNKLYINPPLIFMFIIAEKLTGIKFTRAVNYMSQAGLIRIDIAVSDDTASNSKEINALREENERIKKENEELRKINERLDKNIRETKEKVIKCPVTGLLNEMFFKKYLLTEISVLGFSDEVYNSALILISIDNIFRIRFSYGTKEVDEVLKNTAYIMNSVKDKGHMLFRLQGELFAYYIPDTAAEYAVSLAERIRLSVESSEIFKEKMTVSIGIVCLDEIQDKGKDSLKDAAFLFDIAMTRVRIAKNSGMNMVCVKSSVDDKVVEKGKILIVDSDSANINVLKMTFENLSYKVSVANDGEEALNVVEREEIDLVISEIMVPKIDGFLIRERLAMSSATKNIPFIIVSYLKTEESVKRAMNLNVDYYFKKPYMLSELAGVVKNRIRGEKTFEFGNQ